MPDIDPQNISVQAVPFHRFVTQNQSLGNFLTSNFSEGSCCPYNYRYEPFPYQADIVPLVNGYRPVASEGLLPVHAWQVDEQPRIYYYYSVFYAPHGSNYRYLGVVGYALSRNDSRGTPFHYWYSQYYGFYYTLTGEYPPWGTFEYQDYSWRLPVGGTYAFEPIPIPQDPTAVRTVRSCGWSASPTRTPGGTTSPAVASRGSAGSGSASCSTRDRRGAGRGSSAAARGEA